MTIILIIATAYVAFLIVKPLLIPILLSIIVAYISYPLYLKIKKLIKYENWSALLVSIIILIIIILPIIFVMNALISQTQVAYTMSRRVIITGNIFYGECNDTTPLCNVVNAFQGLIENPKVKYYLEDALGKISTTVIEKITQFIFAIPMRILDFFIMLFTVYYLLKDGPRLMNRIKMNIPVQKSTSQRLFKNTKEVFYAMIYGYFMIAIIQGLLGGLGFFAVGMSSPILWGIIMGIAALLPVFGTALVWLPASMYLTINGIIESDHLGIWKGIGLFIWGVAIVSTVDNIIRPKIVSEKADIHPVIVLIGVVGGLEIFGFIGLIIGPIVLSMMIMIFKLYEELNKRGKNEAKSN